MGVLKEFKDFAMRGNVIDLAIGIVIGAAFGAIVNSLVADILMPLLGIITGGIDFSGLSVTVGAAVVAYGKFIQAILSFIIIAFALFMIVRGINSMKKKEKPATDSATGPSREEVLLAEIRDLLKGR